MKIVRIALIVLPAILAACINIADPGQVKKMPGEQLCEAYYFGRHPSNGTDTSWPTKQADIKKELESRQLVTPDDWALIDQGHIEMNMSECALQAAWGHPLRITHQSTANGNSSHQVYSVSRYADVTDGKITGFRY